MLFFSFLMYSMHNQLGFICVFNQVLIWTENESGRGLMQCFLQICVWNARKGWVQFYFQLTNGGTFMRLDVNGIWINNNWILSGYESRWAQSLLIAKMKTLSKIWECLSDLVLFLPVCSTYSSACSSEESQWTFFTYVTPQLLTSYI